MSYKELYEVNEAINELNDLRIKAEKEHKEKIKADRKRKQKISKARGGR